MLERHYIYGLIDPSTSMIRYIGKAANPRARFVAHINERGDTRKCKWLAELATKRMKPIMVILEETNAQEVFAVEKKWIDIAISLEWEITNTVGVGCDYEDTCIDAAERRSELTEDRQHVDNAKYDPSSPFDYKPEYLLEKLKSNFYRPIFMHGEMVMLSRCGYPQHAAITAVGDYNGYPAFRSTARYFRIPFSQLPPYAIGSLDIHRSSAGGSAIYFDNVDIPPHCRKQYPEWAQWQHEKLISATPATGRTFYAALG